MNIHTLSKTQMMHVTDHLACTDTDLVILHHPDYIEIIERQEEAYEDRQSVLREIGFHRIVSDVTLDRHDQGVSAW